LLQLAAVVVLTGSLLPLSEVLVLRLDNQGEPAAGPEAARSSLAAAGAGATAAEAGAMGAAAAAAGPPAAAAALGLELPKPWHSPKDVPLEHWVWVLKQAQLDSEQVCGHPSSRTPRSPGCQGGKNEAMDI
jgi:hypothetical protein